MTQNPLHSLSPKVRLDDAGLLRTWIDDLPEQVYVKDTEGRYVFNNTGHAKALSSASPEEIAGKTDVDFYPKGLVERYRADEQEIFRSGKPLVNKEEPSVDGEGNERWHSTTKVPLRDESGKIVGLVGVTRDVTEQKEAEEKLHGLQREYEELVDSVDAIIWKGEAQPLRFTFVSHQAEAILGYPVERWLAEPSFWSDHIHPEDREWVVSFCQRAVEDKRSHTFEYRMIGAGGNVVWFRDIVHVAVEGGVPKQLFGVMIDVTERRRTEEALKESEERYRAVIEQSVEAIWLFDPTTKQVLESNTAFQEILGYTAEELKEMTNYDFVAHSREDIDATVRRKVREREDLPSERKYRRKDGTLLDVEVNGTMISYGDKEVVCSVARDLTERKEAEKALRESEERFRTAFEDAPIGVALVDLDGNRFRVNRALCEMLGCSEQVLLDKDYLEHVHPEDREISTEHFRRTLEEGTGTYVLERRYLHADGHVVWNLTSVSLIRDSEGNPSHFVCLHQDITDRKEAEEKLRKSEARLAEAQRIARLGNWEGDAKTGEVSWSDEVFRIYGYEQEFVPTLDKLVELSHPDDRELLRKNIDAALHEGEPYDFEHRVVRQDGEERVVHCQAEVVFDEEGKPLRIVGTIHDTTERKELEEQLRYQAFYDSLTDLPNRLLFLDRLDHALAQVGREGGPVAVLLVDLDDFKVVNDSLGHDAGNSVLAEVAERLRGSVRPGDTVGRIFGDEFTVLLEAPAGEEEAKRVAQRIEECLREPFEAEGQEVFVTASIGITLAETAEDEPKEVLRHADLAMYEAKRHSKTQHEVYDPDMTTRAVERVNLERDLRRAVEREEEEEEEEFEVHYQPKVLLQTGEIAGVEALVRWQHPDRGLLSASEFILLAEETGLINRIGLWVLKESCRQFKEWQERYPEKLGPPFSLCVNLSAREIQHPGLTEKVAEVLRETELNPSSLTIEISERTAKEDAEQTIDRLRELKELDVKLAIDDFGTGYCSLVYLEHSLLDVVKIDRLVIHRKKEDWEECVAIVSAMVSMAHALDLAVVVEGVESEDEVAELKEMGCEMVQGHYFAEPLPSEDLEKLLQGRDSF